MNLSPDKFRDAMTIRYQGRVGGEKSRCEGYGGRWSLQHALNCPVGGLPTLQHDEVNRTWARGRGGAGMSGTKGGLPSPGGLCSTKAGNFRHQGDKPTCRLEGEGDLDSSPQSSSRRKEEETWVGKRGQRVRLHSTRKRGQRDDGGGGKDVLEEGGRAIE
uniref:Uncharacterized protein n=1 Tax=Chromera velia CCMP2878 TaxID=1169474 RepID=A0A0G4HIV6_9ALVE|eukprot:Cvel_27952.t1-p1 / transcript=Cvel_27952.t1 / gene=Cvel_27952 / organism=Chromera_velia_CCMP2878 / gene_product=hypothetical protein / transcript_product=hypothetical protein / location=Cvel_scaffold3568:30-506(+) / protein_length=159 / sequence_SO=supercontig / SO=protein_coding / is_pseudo=false